MPPRKQPACKQPACKQPARTEQTLLLAFDFGTTFSAVAWCHTSQPNLHHVIRQWPNRTGGRRTSNQVPSQIVYNDNEETYRWGFQIMDSEQRIERFKLDLFPRFAPQETHLNLSYPDPMMKPPEPTQKPNVLVKDYLKALHDYAIEDIKSKIGEDVFDTTKVEYILTVPAIWDDKAKDDTRACARDAGFGDCIHMISEPEAAMTFAIETPSQLKKGDTVVLADEGGGTTDLISYYVVERDTLLKVKEAAPGTGALCGSSHVNLILGKFLSKRFEGHPNWDKETLDGAMHHFEVEVKPQFDGTGDNFLLPVSGIPENTALGVNNRGKLRLTLDEMIKIFEPVVSTITTLILNQIKATNGNVRFVLLVGGFGQSSYLRSAVQAVVGPNIEVLQSPDGEVTVVQGALRRALALTSPSESRVHVSSRIARKAFGLRIHVPFQDQIHDINKRFWSDYYGSWRVDEMEWFIKKGDILKEDNPVVKAFMKVRLEADKRFENGAEYIKMYEGPGADNPPKDPRHDGIRPCAILSADLSTIAMKAMRKTRGMDKKKYLVLHYEIRVTFFSAHTEYSLWFENKCYGKVNAEYE